MRRLLLFLLCLKGLGAFDVPLEGSVIDKHLEKNTTGGAKKPRVVQNLSAAIPYDGILYYWKGHYQFDPKLPLKCTFMASRINWTYTDAVSVDGAVLKEVEFGCDFNARCREHKCHHSVTLGMFWGVVLFAAMGISLIFYVRYWACRGVGERVEVVDQSVEMDNFSHPTRPIISRAGNYVPLT